jgi:hypothetical protein
VEVDAERRNPLGLGGAVLDSFCGLIASMRRGSGAVVSAQSLHVAIGRHNRTFADRQQHDSYEFLVALLDVLSEDLNQSPMARRERHLLGIAGFELHGFTRMEITYESGDHEYPFEMLVGWPLPVQTDGRGIGQWKQTEVFPEDNWIFCERCDKLEPTTSRHQSGGSRWSSSFR